MAAGLRAVTDEARAEALPAAEAATPRSVPQEAALLAVIVPTFNERENVARLVARLRACLDPLPWEVIFVDDDSPDGTAATVREVGRGDSRVRCLQRLGRRGLSSACIEGMLASSAPYLAVVDGDLQHDETLLPRMLQVLQEDAATDIVVGSRYMAGGSIGGWDQSRATTSRFATRLSRLVLRAELSDPMSGFFMIRRSAFEETMRKLSGIGFKILVDLFTSAPRPLRFRELPYAFRTRQAGHSKLDNQAAWDFAMLLLEKLLGGAVPVRFIAFTLVGGSGVLVHLLILYLLVEVAGVGFVAGQTSAAIAAMTSNFILNNVLTYRDMRLTGWQWLRGWITFMLACSLGALANVGIASYLYIQVEGSLLLSALAGILVGAVWNYTMTYWYTWRGPALK